MVTITCGFCGEGVAEDRGQAACASCPLGSACGLIRCPSCGYENPRPPRWMARIREWMIGAETAGAVREGGRS